MSADLPSSGDAQSLDGRIRRGQALREMIATAPEHAGLREFMGLTDALANVGKDVRGRAYALAEAHGYEGWDTLVFAGGWARSHLKWRDHLLKVALPEAGARHFGTPDDQTLATIHALKDEETIFRILDRLPEATSWLDLLTPPEE